MIQINRVSTGISGFDKLIDGGFPEKTAVLIAGPPGTGKSIFSLNYLYHGAKDKGENGLYVSLEDTAENVKEQGTQFGWDLEKLEKDGKIKFLEIPFNVTDINLMETLKAAIKKVNAKRMVIDSLSVLILNSNQYMLPIGKKQNAKEVVFKKTGEEALGDVVERRGSQFVYNTVVHIKELGATTLLIADSDTTDLSMTKDGVSEYISDGIIKLGMKDFGKTMVRTLEVLKLRRTKINPGIKTLEFGKKGIDIKEFNY